MKKVLAAVALCGVLLAVILTVICVSYSNREVRLRRQLEAQQGNSQVVFDNTWKILQQQAGVADQYRDSFTEIYPELMEGRYGSARGGALFSWISESNPDFDTTLYAQLQRAIEAQRTVFTREQQELLDLKREHDALRTTIPGVWIVGGRPTFDIKLVTSGKTEEVFSTGREDDLELF